jgi:activator of Hsp90 ATPase-like protein
MRPLPPIRREVLVESGQEKAFEVFTARIGDWWPLATHSVYGAGGRVAFAGGEIVEHSAAGEVSVWGTVTRWEPPSAVAFSWHPGRPMGPPTQVTVSFAARGEQTLVTLEHSGWEVLDDPGAARDEYDSGWPAVLDRYREELSPP